MLHVIVGMGITAIVFYYSEIIISNLKYVGILHEGKMFFFQGYLVLFCFVFFLVVLSIFVIKKVAAA